MDLRASGDSRWRKCHNEGIGSNRLYPFLVAIFFYLWSSLVLRSQYFRNAYRAYLRREPSEFELKLAGVVGYMGLFFGSVAVLY